jgi:hypothetical protein
MASLTLPASLVRDDVDMADAGVMTAAEAARLGTRVSRAGSPWS